MQELITTLEETKARAVAIAAQLAAAVAAAARLDAARARYAPAAARGALLFFALAGLAAVSCMYEHSLAAFLAVFAQALAASPQARRTLQVAATGWRLPGLCLALAAMRTPAIYACRALPLNARMQSSRSAMLSHVYATFMPQCYALLRFIQELKPCMRNNSRSCVTLIICQYHKCRSINVYWFNITYRVDGLSAPHSISLWQVWQAVDPRDLTIQCVRGGAGGAGTAACLAAGLPPEGQPAPGSRGPRAAPCVAVRPGAVLRARLWGAPDACRACQS